MPINLQASVRDEIKVFANRMRKNPTKAEAALWQAIRKRNVGDVKFRRQRIIRGFIADFYSPQLRFVIEVDGKTHDADYDARRDAIFRSLGIEVLRVTNEDVFQRIDVVRDAITKLAARRLLEKFS